jgi:serine/threonine protein kinase
VAVLFVLVQMGVCGSKFCGFVRSGAKRQDGGDRAARAPHGDDAFLHRSSQENSLLHLSRHHRVHPFHRDGDKFGLGANYEIERVLGRGGTGETHLARDRRAGGAGELVAIKLQQRPIPRESVEMSYNECLVSCALSFRARRE